MWKMCASENSWVGCVLLVKARDFPFLVVDDLCCASYWGSHLKLDSREVDLKRLSGEYIAARVPVMTPPASGKEGEGG